MAVVEQPRIAIRDAGKDLLDQIVRLEKQAFPTPWSVEALAREIDHPRALFRVAFDPRYGRHRLAGYLCSWRVVDECHILKIAVVKPCLRCGIGSALLEDSLAVQQESGARVAYLEVRPSNAAAIAFYECHGFDRLGVRPRYYNDTGEDALLLFRALS